MYFEDMLSINIAGRLSIGEEQSASPCFVHAILKRTDEHSIAEHFPRQERLVDFLVKAVERGTWVLRVEITLGDSERPVTFIGCIQISTVGPTTYSSILLTSGCKTLDRRAL